MSSSVSQRWVWANNESQQWVRANAESQQWEPTVSESQLWERANSECEPTPRANNEWEPAMGPNSKSQQWEPTNVDVNGVRRPPKLRAFFKIQPVTVADSIQHVDGRNILMVWVWRWFHHGHLCSDLVFIWRGLYKYTREPNSEDIPPCIPPVYTYLWYNSPKPSAKLLFYLLSVNFLILVQLVYLKMSQRCAFSFH